MKKSELRKIIRESIKELVNEAPLSHKEVYVVSCGGNYSMHMCVANINPQVGDIFKTQDYYHSWDSSASSINNRKWWVMKVTGNCDPSNIYSYGKLNPATGIQEIVLNNSNVINTITGTCSECKNCCNYSASGGNPIPGCNGTANNGIWTYPPGGQQIQATGACWDRCQGGGYIGETYNCKPKGNHPKFGSKCVAVQGAGGQFANLQDCLASGCEGLGSDDIKKNINTTPLTTDPQSKITEPDDEITRI